VFFGLCKAVVTYPDNYASYTVPVRQYRILQSRFLQCILHSKPPCGLLILSRSIGTYKGLPAFGRQVTLWKKTPVVMLIKIFVFLKLL
jgi:hypothetical protein